MRARRKVIVMSSLSKAIQVLKFLGTPPYEKGVTEISGELGIVKSGVHFLLSELVEAGFVVRNPQTRRYHLGPGIFRLGMVYIDARGIAEVAAKVMSSISAVTKTSVLIGLIDGENVFLGYKHEVPGSYIYKSSMGQRFALNAGAIGKLFAAYMDETRLRGYQSKFKYSGGAVTDIEELIRQTREIRKQGYALTFGENVDGYFGLAVPIQEIRGQQMTGALSLVGPQNLYQEEHLQGWLSLLRDGATVIAESIR